MKGLKQITLGNAFACFSLLAATLFADYLPGILDVETAHAEMVVSELSLEKSLAEKIGSTEELAKAQIHDVFETISQQLASGREVKLRGFGTFYLQKRNARTARNPRTGESVQVAAKSYPRFRSSQTLKKAVASIK